MTYGSPAHPQPARAPLVIRLAQPEDLKAASAANRAAYAEYGSVLAPERIARYLDNAGDVWSRLDVAELLVAILDGEVVGSVTYYASGSRSEAQGWPADWAGLRLLAVAPAARGLGAGRALMEASIERARVDGATALALHTTVMMEVARAMYERMGFVRVPERDYISRSGERGAMAYRYDLSPTARMASDDSRG
jgi:ribosomal protein S18 acetylase RimI-like enzyme